MAKKEVIKVPFAGARVKAFLDLFRFNYKMVASKGGCSDTTLRRAIKVGEINEVYVAGMAEYLGLEPGYLMGEKTKEYTRLDKAVQVLASMVKQPEE